ncbi:MAG: esterase-like activity of phytase family protein [Albidovulum sp.]
MFVAKVAGAAELTPQGIYYWRGEGADFGGFSGLSITNSGADLLTVSDRGVMVRADIRRDSAGRIQDVSIVWQAPLRDNFDRPVDGFTADAEALAVEPDGTAFVGFESYTRVIALHPPDMTPTPLHRWDRFKALWGNTGFESLALHPDGRLFAIVEAATDGQRQVLVRAENEWIVGPDLPAGHGFDLTDAAFDAAGVLYLLERRLAYTAGYATRVSRVVLSSDVFGPAEILLETAPGVLDNMEGLSLWQGADGRQMISLISDDNFLPFQNTTIAEFELQE